jgi:uncharacterized oligopeptide transporter (OPT) family protein
MAQDQDPTQFKFPENAYRELSEGESFVPMVPPDVRVPEMTGRVIWFGLLMNVIFSVAATFLALKAGQGIETAIPISILAVGLSGFLVKAAGRASSILENVYVLAISTTSGYVAGGTCFTMPAIYLLSLNKNLGMSTLSLFLQISLVPFLGAILGVIFLIPFRRYFVKDMHGKLPFPEATATNEILATGASGSTHQAWVLIYSFVLAAVYTFCATALHLFSDVFTTGMAKLESVGRPAVDTLAFGASGLFAKLTTGVKAVFAMGTGAYYLGLGYIIGLRYASIICAGSFLSYFVIVPLLAQMDLTDLQRLNSVCKAHDGPEEKAPRFTLPASAAAQLDQFLVTEGEKEESDAAKAARSTIASAFSAHDVQLTEEFSVDTLKYGAEWKLTSGDQYFRLTKSDDELKVFERVAQEPSFTVSAALADSLGALDPLARVRKEIGDEFAAKSTPLANEDVSITVDDVGQKWEIKDDERTYVLRAQAGDGISVTAREPSAGEIFDAIPKNIGIGAIFTAGLISILKMGKVIVTALRQALGSLFAGGGGTAEASDKTDQDLGYGTMALLGLVAVVAMALFFRYQVLATMADAAWLTFISIVIALVITFLFTTVSAWAIAMISVTPISGMTVTTIIITAVLLSYAGLPRGDQSMLATLLIGGVVCTGLSMAGGLVTNFKIGYWLGGSPKRIAKYALVGSLVSAVFVCGTIMVLAYQPGYEGPGHLPAPQANMMKGALESFLGTGQVPWLLYGTGVVVALTVELIGISALAFGLGMYLPMYINTPILVGAIVATLVSKSSKDKKRARARSNKGILIASGLIAGGAIMEVLVNFTTALDELFLGTKHLVGQQMKTVGEIMPFLDVSHRIIDSGTNPDSLARTETWLGLVLFLALCVLVYFDCLRAKPSEDEVEIHM